jgi:hypothetical protein
MPVSITLMKLRGCGIVAERSQFRVYGKSLKNCVKCLTFGFGLSEGHAFACDIKVYLSRFRVI